MNKKWWKEGVIYQIYPRSFFDTNGDGIGDITGIIEKVDYLAELGIDIVWLSPVYQSPNCDNGYDISDYYAVHPDFGDMEKLQFLFQRLHDKGIKVLMDLVVNHTSDEHHWFEEARKSTDNPYRDFYIWKKPHNGEAPNNWKSFFGGSAWEFDEHTGEYYLHYFSKKQPDLNWENPKVRQEVYKIMKFWMEKGVDGFRMDVISLISKPDGFPDTDLEIFTDVIEKVYANGPKIHEYLQEMHQEVISKYDMMTVGEGVGIPPHLANLYVGDSRHELNMIYHFGHMFIDNGPGGKYDYQPITLKKFKDVFNEWDKAIGTEGWNSIYLDNHDFSRMVSRFGNDQEYHDQSSKLLITLLLTLRGTPSIFQGDEIGMTNVIIEKIEDYDDIETLGAYQEALEAGLDMKKFMEAVYIQSRDNSRTPVQWDTSENGGFTSGKPWIRVNRNYKTINVAAQENDENSILSFFKKIIKIRKQHPTWVYGQYESLDNDHPKIFKYIRWDEFGKYLIVLNFSNEPQQVNMEDFTIKETIINNYPKASAPGQLRPWEASVYKIS